MDTARDKRTKRPVNGFDLKRLEIVDKTGYECLACGIPVNPVSFEEHHKRSPHFKLFPKTEHFSNCGYKKEESSYINAETGQISTPDGLPFPYPSRMVIPEDSTFDNSQNSESLNETDNRSRTRTDNSGVISSRPHNYTVDTIRSLAQFYLRFPFDRHLALSVPGIDGINFNDIFQKIAYEDTRDYSEKKILFGTLHYQDTATFKDSIEIKLTQGYWKDKKPVNQYHLRIDTKGWTELEKNALVSEVDIIRNEIKEINDKEKKRNKKNKRWDETIKGWLFFVGEQDEENEFLFHANNWRFICCIAGNFRQGNTPKIDKTKTITNDTRTSEKIAPVDGSNNFTLLPLPSTASNHNDQSPVNSAFSSEPKNVTDATPQFVKKNIKQRSPESSDLPKRSVSSVNPTPRQNISKLKTVEKSTTAKITGWAGNLLKKIFG